MVEGRKRRFYNIEVLIRTCALLQCSNTPMTRPLAGVKANLCTCDMNFDAREAARAVASVSPCLLEGADLVMTIKLPEKCGANQVEKQVDESTAILKESGFGSFQVVHQMTNTPWERTVIAKYLPKADTAATGKQ